MSARWTGWVWHLSEALEREVERGRAVPRIACQAAIWLGRAHAYASAGDRASVREAVGEAVLCWRLARGRAASSLARRMDRAAELAVAAWGHEAQWRKVQEECAELIAAINRYDSGRCSVGDVAGELVDVAVMVAGARVMIDRELYECALRAKLYRLEYRLREAGVKL